LLFMRCLSPSSTGRLPTGAAREDPRRALGELGERLAAAHLERLGFALLARNVRTRHGEIDLIAFDGRALVFVEVKSRRVAALRPSPASVEQSPLASLKRRQQIRLRRLATAWLSDVDTHRPKAREIRFDAVGVALDANDRLLRLEHLEAAW
jgi:putative endonuclease